MPDMERCWLCQKILPNPKLPLGIQLHELCHCSEEVAELEKGINNILQGQPEEEETDA